MGTAGWYDFYHFCINRRLYGVDFRFGQNLSLAGGLGLFEAVDDCGDRANSIISSVFVFISAFMATLVVLTVLVAWTGLDFSTAFSAVVACITNSGPGIGPVVGPAGTFAPLSDFAKYMLSLAMLLGRLEVLTVIVIFTKSFWRN